MNELTNYSGINDVIPYGGGSNFVNDLISAVPMAIASPILAYQRTKAQKKLAEIAIEARKCERDEILHTMRVLAKYGALTPELSQQLMVAYYQPAFPK
ncbi:hypothetical protein CBFG_05681 [Clostridiales bacterium 1_7_47FAA]|uniref:Uncharacterized protein n=1 Tax=Enterocloster hominis (ex Hitch et al. 2024) TaxID=1917870 RepID=A0ABV1D3X9_9FIRM|nr:hypothetical protein CBFG_05681 [Clostridiales bacterium 1_7_47FAA]